MVSDKIRELSYKCSLVFKVVETLSQEELTRYSRQLIIPGFTLEHQLKLKKTKMAIVGLGALGSAVSQILTAAGVGYLRIIDKDVVELSNLNRQLLYAETDLGKPKPVVAAKRLMLLNSNVTVEPIIEELNDKNVDRLLDGVDIVVDCLDNIESRLVVNEFIVRSGKPLVHGAVNGFYGQATTVIPSKTPCLRCLFGEAKTIKPIPVIPPTPVIIASIEAAEAIKLSTGLGNCLEGRLLLYDGLNMEFTIIKVSRNPECPVCSKIS